MYDEPPRRAGFSAPRDGLAESREVTMLFPRRILTGCALFLLPAVAAAQSFDTTAFASLRWREIGPYRGGRSVAVAGSAKRPYEYWMGTTGGGVFKTTDGGMSWQSATDKFFGGTIGAVLPRMSPSPPAAQTMSGFDSATATAPGEGVWFTKD